MILKLCQCGARPVWEQVRLQPRGRRTAQAERLVCPKCGNATGPNASREQLVDEWNSAGWCGQAITAKNTDEPFGTRWQAECLRLRKRDLIYLYMRVSQDLMSAISVNARLCRELHEAKELVVRLRKRRNLREVSEMVDQLVQSGQVAQGDAAALKRVATKLGMKVAV